MLLDGVGDIDWASLGHAYGSAEQVPHWLAALLDPATCARAVDDLDVSLYHQGGGAYSAAAAALPFLIRLAAHPSVPGRADLLDLIGQFARLQNAMVEPWRSEPAALSCRVTLYGAYETFRALMDDDDPAIRAFAAAILVEFVDRADEVVDDLIPRSVDAIDLLWMVGRLGPALSPAKRASVLAWLESSTPAVGNPARLAYLMARRRCGPVPFDELLAAADDALVPADRTDPLSWIESEIVDDRPARLVLARRSIAYAVRTGNTRSMASPGAVLMGWRSAAADLVPDIAAVLTEPDLTEHALHLLAAAGSAARPYLGEIAAHLSAPGRTGLLANWALARLGDERAVPLAIASLTGPRDLYAIGGSHYTDRFYRLTQDPGIADVLIPLAAYADRIVPSIRSRLQRDSTTPTAHQLGEVVIAYGPPAAGAAAEYADMLGTDRHRTACRVLAALGPAAVSGPDAAFVHSRLALHAMGDGFDGSGAAWALFRVIGDPQPFLDARDVWGGKYDASTAARRIADFGPLAIGHLDHIELLLQTRFRSWVGAELAYAHFRVTGDPTRCLEVFDAALEPLRRKRQLPVIRLVLRYVADLGPAAVRFAPLLRQVIEQDERLEYSGGWPAIVEDEEAVRLATAALAAITR